MEAWMVPAAYWAAAVFLALWIITLRRARAEEILARHDITYTRSTHLAIAVLGGLLWPIVLVFDVLDRER